MSTTTRKRLEPEVFDLPIEKMRAGYYTDAYFNHTRAALLRDGRHPNVLLQVFQKKQSLLGGMDEAIARVTAAREAGAPPPPSHTARKAATGHPPVCRSPG